MMDEFEKNIRSMYGDKGQQWLADLPKRIAQISQKYGLRELKPVENMSFHYVARGVLNNKPIIIKLGLNSKALRKEARCLQAFAGHSVPRVIEASNDTIIMECAVPGTTLKAYFPEKETEATQIACRIIQNLHTARIPSHHNFYQLKELVQSLDTAQNIPHRYVFKARQLRDALLKSSDKEVLLHGDLHHENILKNGTDWMVIDPKGFIGDPAFEVAAYLGNPIPELLQESDAKKIIEERIQTCSKLLHLNAERMYDWFYVKSVLCWAWSLEDTLDPSHWEKLVKVLD